jgi:dTDP-4-amino-4,6-dideoxygalactose transaminase
MSSKKSSQAQPGPDPAITFQCPGWPPARDAVFAELSLLISSGDWAKYQPEVLDRLRLAIAEYLTCKHVRLVSSGSAAVEMALRAAVIGQNPLLSPTSGQPSSVSATAEVICPAFDYPGNARAARLIGAVPVLVDNSQSQWTIDPAAVLAAATPRTVAVIASHLYGEIAPIVQLRDLCDRHGWILLEDVCQMPGGRSGDKPLGTFGHVAAWSFGGSKPLTAGCGGAITTNDDRIAQRLASYADRPSDAYPLSPLQAAALLPQWSSLADLAPSQHQKLSRLVAAIADQTPGWKFPATNHNGHWPVFYKIPVTIDPVLVDAGVTTGQIIDQANSLNIPAGQPFRIPGRLAASRGRVESTQHAQQIAAHTWLIDHRVLATDDSGIDQLAEVLIHLYKQLRKCKPE